MSCALAAALAEGVMATACRADAQTQAAHMRAVPEHRSHPDCESSRECPHSIPTVRNLTAGEYARRMRACTAAKTIAAAQQKKAIEQARAETSQRKAELQAARAQAHYYSIHEMLADRRHISACRRKHLDRGASPSRETTHD